MWPGQAGRPEGGGREAWAGVPAPTWTLICSASQTLQLFPVPSPLDAQSKSWRGVEEVRIFL